MKKFIIILVVLSFTLSSLFGGDFIRKMHKSNAKKSQHACYKNTKWAGKSCNTAGVIWLKKLNNKEKALKWFKIGCEKKSYFRACMNYKKYKRES